MALMESISVKLGTQMPTFELKDPSGKLYKSDQVYGAKGLLVAFTCNHCPYAQAIWPRLIQLAKDVSKLGVNTVGINPNIHPGYPDDAPERMKEKIKEWGISFPYLVDETQEVARTFQAQCTPDLYLFDSAHHLVYHGRLDDNWKEETKVKKRELKEAIENLAAGKQISHIQNPSMGCSIKWRE
ncbi:MAG: peroxiredoxin [Omnitrophica bacterium RIFCSPHIGHO2_02_FULL_46_11]|nr:MAG: peroxiredoxin [Omnitrophica bacterium RIFCSPHIGHO2_02_FULL_46_11]OGW87056.1 MAG: peroxiredoxin [Omnitrophica bacterium RIFCSPLOWO2_01_FULL_45_10b]